MRTPCMAMNAGASRSVILQFRGVGFLFIHGPGLATHAQTPLLLSNQLIDLVRRVLFNRARIQAPAMPRAGGVVAALLLVLGVALQQCSAQHAPNSPQSYMEVRRAELYETQILKQLGVCA